MHIISQSNQLLKIIHLIDKFRGFKNIEEETKSQQSKEHQNKYIRCLVLLNSLKDNNCV